MKEVEGHGAKPQVSERIKPRTLWFSILVALVIGAGIMWGAYWIVLNFFDTPGQPDELRGRATALVTGVLASVAIVLAVLKERVSIRAHNHIQAVEERRIAELSDRLERDRLTDLRGRYVTAAEQLGRDSSAVRIAGANALAALALEWDDLAQRQACIDVLCAYLRTPPLVRESSKQIIVRSRRTIAMKSLSSAVDYGDRQVRLTIQRLIHTHLTADLKRHWGAVRVDLSGAWLEDFVMSGSTLQGVVQFDGATFEGNAKFDDVIFAGGSISFNNTRFSEGTVSFDRSKFAGGVVSFNRATFSGARVSFEAAEFSGGSVYFTNADFSGGRVQFRKAIMSGGNIAFSLSTFSLDAELSFDRVSVSGTLLQFAYVRISGGAMDFSNVTLSHGAIAFSGASMTGGSISFRRTALQGGTVSFDKARLTGGHTSFEQALFEGGWVVFDGATVGDGILNFKGARFEKNPPTKDGMEFTG